jgi:prepilin-type N-terminal cleavage/methylation domain-containing protein
MRNRTADSAGFTLIEMMIVVAILGVLTAQLFVVFANQKRVFMSNERTLDVQESSRLTLDLVSFDTRMAGFMVPKWAAVSSVDGGTDHADRLCVSDSSFPFVAPTNGSTLDSKIQRFNGASVSQTFADHVDVAANSTDIDGDGIVDFKPGAGVIVASSAKTYCAVVQSVSATQIFFSSPEDATAHLGAATSDMRAVPANVYVLDEGALELRRNGLLLASQVEDFQVEYWLDNSAVPNGVEDGNNEFPVNDLANPDPPGGGIPADNAQVRRVRVSVTSRTLRDEGTSGNSAAGKLTYGRPALANRNASPDPDTFRRRSFSASILPRNLVAVGDE